MENQAQSGVFLLQKGIEAKLQIIEETQGLCAENQANSGVFASERN